jgi:hypothetical protein
MNQALSIYDPHQPVDGQWTSQNFGKEGAHVFETAKVSLKDIWCPSPDLPGMYIEQLEKEIPTTSTSVYCDHTAVGTEAIGFSTAIQVSKGKYVEPVVFPGGVYASQPRFITLQKWECAVLEVREESFTARLIDQTNQGQDEEAEFSLEEVPLADLPLLKPDAIFYWNIGYSDSLSGQRTRVSILRFRRLPVWRAEELETAKKEAAQLGDMIGWK